MKNKNALLLISGIITGATAVHFLNSPKGKELLRQITKKGEELSESIIEQSIELVNEGKAMIENTTNTGEEILSESKEAVTDYISDFQKGIDQAKKKLQNA